MLENMSEVWLFCALHFNNYTSLWNSLDKNKLCWNVGFESDKILFNYSEYMRLFPKLIWVYNFQRFIKWRKIHVFTKKFLRSTRSKFQALLLVETIKAWSQALRPEQKQKKLKMHTLDRLNKGGRILLGAIQTIEGEHFYRSRFHSRYQGLYKCTMLG